MPIVVVTVMLEIVLAGAIAQRFPGEKVVCNRAAVKFEGNPKATERIHRAE